ncbi:Uncharacterised protein [Actinomyces bovis]|uniref:Uncharacterized protein n=2 Tax=Actinomyces bovis TaxID=1658 RepID=A0ABY1VR50_9ACTO|nr:Uncharacterised protein [Actinomyces bovis]VEG55950.1 Uncharacterised protein [Actinomyces israelii]
MQDSWAPVGWSPSVEYQDDAPFGSVLGDPLTGSLIYDVSVLDAVPGWQPEDGGIAVDPAASEQERADQAQLAALKEELRRRVAARQRAERSSAPTASRTTASRTTAAASAHRTSQATAARTTVPHMAAGYGNATVPGTAPGFGGAAGYGNTAAHGGAMAPRTSPGYGSMPGYGGLPGQARRSPRPSKSTGKAPSQSPQGFAEQVKPFIGWIVLLLIFLLAKALGAGN